MFLGTSPVTWQLWCLGALALAMVMAVEVDLRERRIPNVLILLMLSAGIALNVIGPDNGSGGPLDYFPGALGLRGALRGVLTGLILFLPLYLLRAMGAGDVKLMAALGSFVGPVETVNLALSIFAVGGVIALARMAWRRNSHIVFRNVSLALRGMSVGTVRAFDPLTQSADHMPYALAFAGGLLVYGYWRLSGGAPLISF